MLNGAARAPFVDRADRTTRPWGATNFTPKRNNRQVHTYSFPWRNQVLQWDTGSLIIRVRLSDSKPLGDARNVRIDRNYRILRYESEQYVRRFRAHPRQGHEFLF